MDIKGFIQWLLNSVTFFVTIMPWQKGLMIWMGKKISPIGPGLYFKVPYLHSVYIQEDRIRVCPIPIQTVTTKDGKTLSIDSAISYRIDHIGKLYSTMFHPESNIVNICMREMAVAVTNNNLLSIEHYEEIVLKQVIDKVDVGIVFESYYIKTFAEVRTYRLIQDYSWSSEGLDMNKKHV